MAEWSKAVDLSSTIFGCAGSNPAGTINRISHSNYQLFKKVGFRFNSGIGVTQLAQFGRATFASQ